MWESKMWVLAVVCSFFVSPVISDPSFGGGGRNRAANDNSEVLKELGLDIGSEGTGKQNNIKRYFSSGKFEFKNPFYLRRSRQVLEL